MEWAGQLGYSYTRLAYSVMSPAVGKGPPIQTQAGMDAAAGDSFALDFVGIGGRRQVVRSPFLLTESQLRSLTPSPGESDNHRELMAARVKINEGTGIELVDWLQSRSSDLVSLTATDAPVHPSGEDLALVGHVSAGSPAGWRSASSLFRSGEPKTVQNRRFENRVFSSCFDPTDHVLRLLRWMHEPKAVVWN
jgi:hypothetical protein